MGTPQTDIDGLRREVRQLRRKTNLFQATTLLLLVIAVGYGFVAGSNPAKERIVAKEIIVQDEYGNDRIILSAAIGETKTRQRTDKLEGMLILDEHGTDRVVVGATPTIHADGQIVTRINDSNPYGFAFNDQTGNERGGFGFYDDRGFVSFGMDNRTGEGLTMFVADDNHYGQKVGLVMQREGGGQVVYLGANQNNEAMLNLDVPDKGRLSILIDSAAQAKITSYNYSQQASEVLVESGR